MAFDQPTRRLLENLVSDARRLLVEEFKQQLRTQCGLDPDSGAVSPLARLTDLDDARAETARLLQETAAHYQATSPQGGATEAIDRVLREQAFTVLNRLAALRMAEARGLIVEAVGDGYDSKGFRLYAQVAGPALGSVADRHRSFLFSLFDELALDLPVLFDRWAPQGRLFPEQSTMEKLFKLLNAPEIEALWAEDETIGWIYQYFNSKDERKKMRDESAAPRNSRELAVRNQFFTPRYVVEFLTDNTLGRTWYEMTKAATRLVESCRYMVRRPTEIFLAEGEAPPEPPEEAADLSQEELLKQPVHIPHRALKDPREIRMLDPACGSMHFGLYAFDLYLAIYEEAWEIADLPSPAGLPPLGEGYADREGFLRDVPRLILEHNIHGIDIDPRAVQIAGLSLWLRAQRAWQEQGIKPAERPRITRSNVVCAEPMPGEETFLDEFVESQLSARPEGRLLGQLVRRVFEAMKLAGEAGALLKIEEEIAGAVAEAKKKWVAQPRTEQGLLFAAEPPLREQLEFDLDVSGITDERFWKTTEERIYEALEAYAERAEQGGGYQRRLFAEDAARGFAFVDVCRKRYDVVLMNPPFGQTTPEVRRCYPDCAQNLYVAFHRRANQVIEERGLVGVINSRTFVTYREFEGFRDQLLSHSPIELFADLGWEVLDGAQVETAAYVTTKPGTSRRHFGPFFRLLAVPPARKDAELARLACWETRGLTYFIRRSSLRGLPGSPLCYWSSERFVKEMASAATLHPAYTYVGQGASPHAFFFRVWWEVEAQNFTSQWRRICRGGDFSPFFRSNPLVIDWLRDGAGVKEYILKQYPYLNGNYGWKIQDESMYGLPGLTWGKRNERFNVQAMAAGHIFTDEGQGIILNESCSRVFLLGYMNSSLVAYFLSLTSGLQKHYPYIREVPIVKLSSEATCAIEAATRVILSIKQTWDSIAETSPGFTLPLPSMMGGWSSLVEVIDKSREEWLLDVDALSLNRAAINRSVLSGTELSDEDVAEIEGITATFPTELPSTDAAPLPNGNYAEIVPAVLSYCTGVAFARWDIRYATGEKRFPELPDPFAPLPTCPPGMLQNEQNLPLTPDDVHRLQSAGQWDYPIDIPWDGILVDDPGHPLDIESRVCQAFEIIWQDRADAIEHEACEILGVKSLREYFRKPAAFFADHLKRYSKSRRQAPIYWPLSTASGGYTLWIYYHRLTDQTLFTCVNDFVEPKLLQVAEDIAHLRQKTTRSRDDNKDLEALLDLEAELCDLRDELLRLTRLPWKPNLNDGVQITAAPLWKLFAYKPWQKKLQETWKALEKGEYDWAHLAYSIWPDRVREKCRKDKSLAIAHDLEDLYEEAPAAPKKRGRKSGGA